VLCRHFDANVSARGLLRCISFVGVLGHGSNSTPIWICILPVRLLTVGPGGLPLCALALALAIFIEGAKPLRMFRKRLRAFD